MIKFKQFIDESLKKPADLDRFRRIAIDPYDANEKVGGKWFSIGDGFGGAVYKRKGDNFVVKIFDVEDTGYKFWLLFCLSNQHNSFVPKIKGRPVPINNRIAAVRLELLSKDKSGIQLMHMTDWWSNYKKAIRWKDNDYLHEMLKRWTWSQKREDFVKVMSFIDNQNYNDVRRDNVMYRSNGELVFTDPIFKTKEKRLTKYSREIESFLQSRFEPT